MMLTDLESVFRGLKAERADGHPRRVEHRPGHRRQFQDATPDRLGLFLFALQFQLGRLLLPVFQARFAGLDPRLPGRREVEQGEHGVAAIGLDQVVAFAVDRAEAAMLDLEQLVGHPGGFPAVAEIGGQQGQPLPLGQRRIAPEQALDLAPGEEIGMHDLVGIAAQEKVAGPLQGLQHQGELHRGDVLHLVDHHEVITRRRLRQPLLGDQVQVEQPGFAQPCLIFLEQVVELIAPLGGEDGLPSSPERRGNRPARWLP